MSHLKFCMYHVLLLLACDLIW